MIESTEDEYKGIGSTMCTIIKDVDSLATPNWGRIESLIQEGFPLDTNFDSDSSDDSDQSSESSSSGHPTEIGGSDKEEKPKKKPKAKSKPAAKETQQKKKEEPKEKTKPEKKPTKEKAKAETKETEPKKKAEKRKVIAFIYSLFWHEFLMIAGIIIFALCIRTCITDSKIVIFDFDIPFRFSNFFSSKPLSNIEESFNITLRKFYFMNMRYNFTASRNFSSSIVMYPCKLPVVIVDFRQYKQKRPGCTPLNLFKYIL